MFVLPSAATGNFLPAGNIESYLVNKLDTKS